MTADLVRETDPEVPEPDPAPEAVEVAPEAEGTDELEAGEERRQGPVRQILAPALSLLVWIYVYLLALLGGWVLLASTVAGWQPLVITSGSMEPAIRAGDVLLVSDHPDSLVAQRSVITFSRDGDLVAHRVFEVVEPEAGEAGYITKGDANVSTDARRVPASEVEGVGRLVVPVVGLPVLWASEGQMLPVIAWAAVTLLAVLFVARTAAREYQRRRRAGPEEAAPVATAGIRRVRVLVAVMIAIQYLVDPGRFDVTRTGAGREGVLIVSVGVLVILNLVSARIGRRDPASSRRMAFIELTIDTLLVVFIATATGTDGIGWVLFALPIIEAAVRFGLTGGLVHWMVLTTITVGARIGFAESAVGNGVLLGELEDVLDQLSVLFIVVIPGAYLAEQLIADVHRQQQATRTAVDRGRLLEQVVASGHAVNRLGETHLDALCDGAVALGYTTAEILVHRDGVWRRVAVNGSVDLPTPGAAGSGVAEDQTGEGVVVDARTDPDPTEREALEAFGLGRLVAVTLSDDDRGRVVLRAATLASDRHRDGGRIQALRLFAAQAAIALQNDQLLTELTSVHDELEHQATHDALTGLPNRTRVLGELRTALDAGEDATLLFLDLDGFKPVNDRHGHDVGDDLLKVVADRLVDAAGEGGLVARLGGDEFTVLLIGPDSRTRGPAVAGAIHDALARPIRLDMEQIDIGTSIGLAHSEPAMPAMELVRRADVAMYHAKRVEQWADHVVYSPALDEEEARRAELARDLPAAMTDGGIWLAYQPILFVGRGDRIVGLEALVRWTHPRHGAVGPEELIQLAEEIGQRDALQALIVTRAAHEMADIVADHPDDGLFVTVNASPAELRSADTVTAVEQALETSGLPAESLFVEISERLVDPDEEEVAATMHALRELGVKLLLDDFGQGQTSLSFLHQLPVTGIKLDRLLVVNSVRSETERVVVEAIIDLSNRLGLTVIAEGIETADHLNSITGAGCHIVQGYHFHPPMELERIRTLLTDQARWRGPTWTPTRVEGEVR